MAVAPARRAALVEADKLFILCQRGSSSADESGKVAVMKIKIFGAAGTAKGKTSWRKSCAEIALDDLNTLIALLRMSNAITRKNLADAGKYFGGHRWAARVKDCFKMKPSRFENR